MRGPLYYFVPNSLGELALGVFKAVLVVGVFVGAVHLFKMIPPDYKNIVSIIFMLLGAFAGTRIAVWGITGKDYSQQVSDLKAREEELRKATGKTATIDLAALSSSQRLLRLERSVSRVDFIANVALSLALVGPAFVIWVVYYSLDPKYLAGSIAISGVPLTIGAVLHRYGSRVREHCRDVEQEIAQLERVSLAVQFSSDTPFAEQAKKSATALILRMTRAAPSTTTPERDELIAALASMLSSKVSDS